MSRKTRKQDKALDAERTEILQKLSELEPLTPLGEKLIALSMRGLEEGIEPLTTDEVNAYLGRERDYVDVH